MNFLSSDEQLDVQRKWERLISLANEEGLSCVQGLESGDLYVGLLYGRGNGGWPVDVIPLLRKVPSRWLRILIKMVARWLPVEKMEAFAVKKEGRDWLYCQLEIAISAYKKTGNWRSDTDLHPTMACTLAWPEYEVDVTKQWGVEMEELLKARVILAELLSLTANIMTESQMCDANLRDSELRLLVQYYFDARGRKEDIMESERSTSPLQGDITEVNLLSP